MGILMLVRHGQASFGAADYDVLSPLGVRQSRRVAELLSGYGVTPSTVIHGGMRRQRETAECLLEGAASWDLPLEVDGRWAELDHLAVMSAHPSLTDADRESLAAGRMARGVFHALYQEATARWVSGLHDEDYPETFAGFADRVGDALGHAARRAGEGRTAIVVTSGGPIAAAGALLAGLGERHGDLATAWARLNEVVVNGSVTRVVVGSSGTRLLTFNEHAGLDRELLSYR